MIEFILIAITIALTVLVLVLAGVYAVLDRINTSIATQSAVQLAYLKHADSEELRNEAAAIQLDLIIRSGALGVIGRPQGEVESATEMELVDEALRQKERDEA